MCLSFGKLVNTRLPFSVDSYDAEHLGRIIVMALHCQQPIQAFRDKMSSSEASLRTKKKTGSIIGRRIHWSMVERKYAESLQDSVASQMISINVLMGARMM